MRQSVIGFGLVRVRDIGSFAENDAFPLPRQGFGSCHACGRFRSRPVPGSPSSSSS